MGGGGGGTDGWGPFLFSPMGASRREERGGFDFFSPLFIYLQRVGQTLLAVLTLSLWFASEPAVHKTHFAVRS